MLPHAYPHIVWASCSITNVASPHILRKGSFHTHCAQDELQLVVALETPDQAGTGQTSFRFEMHEEIRQPREPSFDIQRPPEVVICTNV